MCCVSALQRCLDRLSPGEKHNVKRLRGKEKIMAFGKRTFLIVLTAFFIAIALWLGIFPPRAPRVFLNQRRAVESIRTLNLAEHEYVARHPDRGFACNLSDFGKHGSEPLSRVALVDRVLASGTKSSYRFEVRCVGDQKPTGYTITAIPMEPGTTGKYALCTDQIGEIWYSESGVASDCLAMHKPIEQKYR
jgi:hypothetical protein